MNQYITGSVIKELREKNHLTQAQLADRLCVSDKAISKWETGKGYPDISLLEPIAHTFGVSVTELSVSCHGLQLVKLYPEGMAETRLKVRGVKRIYCFCNRDGLFYIKM